MQWARQLGQNNEAPTGTPITCETKGEFTAWMSSQNGCVAMTTYQAGKVAMVGWNGAQVSIIMRDFQRPMGMARNGDRLAIAMRDQVMLFSNARALAVEYMPNQRGRYDALFVPRVGYNTGECQMHDLAYGKTELWAVNTRFSCLCTLSDVDSFVPRWHPKFVTDFTPEDRCHLNGLALKDGEPKFVTALGETDAAGTWRENKAQGGIVIDVPSNEIICRGLSMPHSPRWHRDKLWLLNSGVGELCILDTNSGKLTTVAKLPGFLRGLDFIGDFALIGMSKVREKHLFSGLPVTSMYPQLLCGAAVIDLRNGAVVGMFEFTGGCNELYETIFIPGIHRPNILNMVRNEGRQGITTPKSSFWFRTKEENTPNGGSPTRS